MTTDQLVQDGLRRLADAVDTSPPPLEDLLDAPMRVARAPAGRRRPLVAAAAALVIGLGIGAIVVAERARSGGGAPSSPPASSNPSGRVNGELTDPRDVDLSAWLRGAPTWPVGQPTEYLVFDVAALDGWTQLDAIGGHRIDDGASYSWSSKVNDVDGRQFHLAISNSTREQPTPSGSRVDVDGVAGTAGDGTVTWQLDATHTAAVTEFGTVDTERAVTLARQLTTTIVPAISASAIGGIDGLEADPNAAFAGTVDGVAWSATGTVDSTELIVAHTTWGRFGHPDPQGSTATLSIFESGDNDLCVFVAGYLPNGDATAKLVLSDATTVTLPTLPLDDGVRWFAACLPYALDAVAVEAVPADGGQPTRVALHGPYLRPTVGTFQ